MFSGQEAASVTESGAPLKQLRWVAPLAPADVMRPPLGWFTSHLQEKLSLLLGVVACKHIL